MDVKKTKKYIAYRFHKDNLINCSFDEYRNHVFKIFNQKIESIKNREYLYENVCVALKHINKDITKQNIISIFASGNGYFKNCKETKKFLVNTNKSLNSPFLKSIFNFLKFTDLNGYIKFLKMFYNNKFHCSPEEFHKKSTSIWSDFNNYCKLDNEFELLLNPKLLISLQKEWLETYSLFEFIGKNSPSQGEKNGPDIIFIDGYGKKIGLEIVRYGKSTFSCSPNIKNVDNYMDIAFKKSKERGDIHNSFEEFIKTIDKLITCKLNKKYKETNRLYLLVVIESYFVPAGYIEFYRYIVNKNKKFKERFNKIIVDYC